LFAFCSTDGTETGVDTGVTSGATSGISSLFLILFPAIITSEKGTFLQTLTSSARFKDVKIPQIHNIIPGDMPWAFQHTGTFAYNNTYYYFDDSGLCHTKFDTDHYIHEAIVPKELTPKEAVMWGYNMLKTNPYNFSNTMLTFEGPIQLLGVLPYDADNNLVMTPQVNQTLHFECFYKGREARVYTVVWEWKEPGASNWTQIKTEDITIAADKKFLCEFSAPNNAIMLKLTATNKADDIDTQVLTIGFDFGKGVQGNGANAQQKIYDLRQATSMTYWKNRLVAAYKNLLFVGEVNDPSYFPYPNNLEPFQEDIIHVLGYLDNLLVFTSSQLHVITLGTDGLTWYVRTIQSNLNIQPCDVPLIRVVKIMVFFKSGNYYYMVVPKASSTTGELTIAPVSRPIENLFDHFKEVIADILKKVYDYTDDFTLVHCHNFLDFEDVHNIYTFQTSKDVFVNIAVLYNTIDRSWRFYLYESKHILKSFKQDATMKGMFMGLVPMGGRPGIQLLRFNNINCVDDYYYPEQAAHELFFKNYQMLDTGYRDIFTNIKKRFREFQ
jgi:hypothetical protein